ncbi:MAG: BspA family leucine-rich repeat surface protein [Bacilli bacterium]|nr:BspA family leucine-rich repeat surface protein [Bacilli bacterium]
MNRVHKLNKLFILFLILFISIGFAIISTSLTINGVSSILGNTWDVHFENVRVKHSVEGNPIPVISNDRLSVTYTANLNYPGDYFEFTVDTVNSGTIDAMVETISNTQLTPSQAQVLTVEIDANVNDVLLHGNKRTYTIKLKYKDDIDPDDLLDSDFSVNLTFSLTYKQADRVDYSTAKFKTGNDIRNKMVSLASSYYGSFTETTYGYLIPITKFLKSSTLKSGLTSDNVISTNDSEVPIYMWYEHSSSDGTDIIYWYSEANIVYLNQNSSFMFYKTTEGNNKANYFGNLTDVSGLFHVDTSNVTDMSALFCFCLNLQNFNLLNWDTSHVTNLDYMFAYCRGISEIDLSNFNTSSVTNMGSLFRECSSLEEIDLSNFVTSSVQYMDYLFSGCTNLSFINIRSFNTSNVIGMSYMFNNCTSLVDLYIESFNTQNVIYMDSMFNGCSNLTTIFVSYSYILNSNLSSTNMFSGCTSLVGGHGTTYNSSIVDATYARPDGYSYNQSTSSWNNDGSNGYFTIDN